MIYFKSSLYLKITCLFLSVNSQADMATGLPSFKVILHGEYGVGKSSIFRRFMNDSFTPHTGKQSTIGLDQCTRTMDVDGQDVKVKILTWNLKKSYSSESCVCCPQ